MRDLEEAQTELAEVNDALTAAIARAEAAEAAIERVRATIATKTWPSAMVRAEAVRAALAPQTPGGES